MLSNHAVTSQTNHDSEVASAGLCKTVFVILLDVLDKVAESIGQQLATASADSSPQRSSGASAPLPTPWHLMVKASEMGRQQNTPTSPPQALMSATKHLTSAALALPVAAPWYLKVETLCTVKVYVLSL